MKKIIFILTIVTITLPIVAMKRTREQAFEKPQSIAVLVEDPYGLIKTLGQEAKNLTEENTNQIILIPRPIAEKIPSIADMINELTLINKPINLVSLSPVPASKATIEHIIHIIENVYYNPTITSRYPDFFETYTPVDIPSFIRTQIFRELRTVNKNDLANLIIITDFLGLEWIVDITSSLWLYKGYTLQQAQSLGIKPDTIENHIKKYINNPYLHSATSIADLILSNTLPDIQENYYSTQQQPFNKLDLKNKNITNIVGLSLIAEDTRKKITMLNLNDNYIENLPAEAFAALPNLEYLKLEDNLISNITNTALHKLPKLLILQLGGNKLTTIKKIIFETNTTLKKLYLSFNPIIEIQDNAFETLKELWYLDLAETLLTHIYNSYFTGLENLTDLLLQNCNIQYIAKNAFQNLDNIEDINLSQNKITDIKADWFSNLHNLEKLDLSDNEIASIDPNDFNDLTGLEELFLFTNPIDTQTIQAIRAFFSNRGQNTEVYADED